MHRSGDATPSTSTDSEDGEGKAEYDDIVITEEFIAPPDSTPRVLDSPSSVLSPSPSTPPHPHLNESISSLDDSLHSLPTATFSSLSSSIASLHTAIARLSRRLDEPHPVYLVDSAASAPAPAQRPSHQQPQPRPSSSPPISASSPHSSPPSSPSPAHRPATGRRRSSARPYRARRALSPSVRFVIERQQRLMAEVMQLLSLPPHLHVPAPAMPAPISHPSRAEVEDEVRHGSRAQPFLHFDDAQLRSSQPSPPPVHYQKRRPPDFITNAPSPSRRSSLTTSAIPPTAASYTRSRAVAASSARRRSSPSPEVHFVSPSPPPVHPPLPASLQAQLAALRRKEDKWKGRLRSNRTQRMREEQVRSKTREEEEERQRWEDEEKEERSRKELIDRAMRDRWAAPHSSEEVAQSAQASNAKRIEWVRRRDAGRTERKAEASPHAAATTKDRNSSRERAGEKRRTQRSGTQTGDEARERAQVERGSSAVLFTAAELRSLGFVGVDNDEDGVEEEGSEGEEKGDEAAASLHRALSRLGLRA